MSKWLFLGLAIFSEVVATASLKSTEGFTRWGPWLAVGRITRYRWMWAE
ncbi:MAG: SMR family transporter [Candidatus Thermoplasmatota archaeon]|nr:SMR family transporter [Candidatus Thermoplasmatota archaeon]